MHSTTLAELLGTTPASARIGSRQNLLQSQASCAYKIAFESVVGKLFGTTPASAGIGSRQNLVQFRIPDRKLLREVLGRATPAKAAIDSKQNL